MSTPDRSVGGVAVAALLVVTFGSWLAAPHVLPSIGVRVADVYEALSALFSGLALAGVVVAIVLQSRELRAQREEMGAQRVEMAAARQEAMRSASAQEVVAAIAAATALLPHYEALAKRVHVTGGVYIERPALPKQRLEELHADLELLYDKIREVARNS